MKKIFVLWLIIGVAGFCANAAQAGYTTTETVNTYEKLTIDTVKYIDGNYVAPKCARAVKSPCRAASSLDVARGGRAKCAKNCAKSAHLKPVRVKTYTEVIDHYQIYQPVVTYKPAGTYTTRRYIDAPCPQTGTCPR